jgi:hypothetical protein
MADFHGHPVRRLSSKYLELDYLATAGPRIVTLKYKDSDNLLAEVLESSISTPYGDYSYVGGHRLWHAPESMPRSYIPDGDGLEITDMPGGVILEGKIEPGTGIRKRLEIRLDPEQPRISINHTLTNLGLWEIELAPWAITMFRLGGTAVLPICGEDASTESLLPNRRIALWPYSHVDDPRLELQDDFILIRAKPDLPLFKIGTFNPKGWAAYWRDNILFRKTFSALRGVRHPDYDCNAEIYCDSHVIELESIGTLSRLAPGASLSHTETWDLYDRLDQGFLSKQMIEHMQSL